MKIYFVECPTAGKNFDDGIVIPLNPISCYLLAKNSIKYKIPEEFYNIDELNKGEEQYFISQMNWINKIDDFILKNNNKTKELGIKPTRLYGYHLKNFVDPIFLNAIKVESILKNINPTEVVHFHKKSKGDKINYSLKLQENFLSEIIRSICKSREIPYEPVLVNSTTSLLQRKNNRIPLEKLVFLYEFVKQAEFSLKNKNIKGKFSNNNIFVIKKGYGINNFIRKASINNAIYTFESNKIFKIDNMGRRIQLKKISKKFKIENINNQEALELANKIQRNKEIIDWLDNKCNFNIKEIFLPRFMYFLTEVCPILVHYTKAFMDFYQREKIDFVLTPHKFKPWEFAAMAAAKKLKDVTAVQIMHGYSPGNSNTWKLTEFPTDLYFITDKEFKKHFEKITNNSEYKFKKIETNKCWLDNHSYINSRKNKPKKPRITFVPTMLMGNKQRYDGSFYPDTWYYVFHEKIINFFSELKGYTFIYKGIPSSDDNYSPIPDFIKDNEIKNVEYSCQNLIDEYKKSYKVITDFPSTTMIESLAMGIPTLALYHKSLKMRQTAKKKFGNILQEFEDIHDCKKNIIKFLNAKYDKYQFNIFKEKAPTLYEYFSETITDIPKKK